MAWDTKYRCEFTDILGLDWKVDIEDETAASTITSLQAAGDPLNIEFLADSDDLYSGPIKGSIADLTVYSDTNFALAALCATEDMQFRMSVYHGSTLYWRGFLITDNYSEPYDAAKYKVTISASDGLGVLKNKLYKYQVTDPDDTYYNGRILVSQILVDILSKIQITGFKEYVNIYETSMTTTSTASGFDQLSIDVDVFKDMYCYEVLAEILKIYNANIRIIAGEAIIYRPTELTGTTVYGRVFTTSAAHTGTSLTPLQYISRSTNTSDIRDIEGGTMMIQGPAKKLTLNQDYKNRDSWLDSWVPKASDFTYVGLLDWTLAGWSFESGCKTAPVNYFIPSETDGFIVVGRNNYADKSVYMYQTIGAHAVATSNVIGIEFEYQWFSLKGSTATNQSFYYSVISDDPGHYLQEDDDSYCSWTAGSNQIGITEDVLDGNSGWKSYKRQISTGLPHSSTYRIKFHGTSDTEPFIWIGIKNIKFFSTSDAITILKRHHIGPFPKLARKILKTPEYIITYFNNIETISKEIVLTNAISGKELDFEYILGDVIDSGIDNILEQFAGSLATSSRDTLALTADDFAAAHGADFGAVTITTPGNDIVFTADTPGVDFNSDTSITNITGDLSGTVDHTTNNIVGQTKKVRIFPNNSAGSYDIRVTDCADKTMTFDSDEATTCINFVTDQVAYYNGLGITLTTAQEVGSPWRYYCQLEAASDIAVSKVNQVLTFDVTIETEQTYSAAQARVDTITLSGGSGTAKIVCNALPSPSVVNIDVDEALTPSSDWNTRGGSELKELLKIIGDELAEQFSRPKQFLSLPILEGNSVSNTPHVNLIGNFKDDLNQIGGNDRVFVFNKGNFKVIDREWNLDLIEII